MWRTGALESQRGAAQKLVDVYPNRTATELAALSMVHEWARCLGEDEVSRRYALCRRLPELVAVEAEPGLFSRERRWHPR